MDQKKLTQNPVRIKEWTLWKNLTGCQVRMKRLNRCQVEVLKGDEGAVGRQFSKSKMEPVWIWVRVLIKINGISDGNIVLIYGTVAGLC